MLDLLKFILYMAVSFIIGISSDSNLSDHMYDTLSWDWSGGLELEYIQSDIESIDLSVMPDDIDESLEYLYDFTVVDSSANYLAHPDSILLNDGGILQVYPQGHGLGSILTKISYDDGLTYTDEVQDTPESWEDSRETPTVYRLEFTQSDRDDILVLISAVPNWNDGVDYGGFNTSVSYDEGQTWTEFELFYETLGSSNLSAIVAMSSLTQLKEDGEFVDKWLGTFHDSSFNNYSSILTIDEDGKAQWSEPEKYLSDQWIIQYTACICEVEIIRSDEGQGDELCIIARSNNKYFPSLIAFSQDEGQTWSDFEALPSSLNGERLKAEYLEDGRLVITYRSIVRDSETAAAYGSSSDWYSQGLMMWVGTYEDLKEGNDGQYLVKLAHIYLDGTTEASQYSGADTGYCGIVTLDGNEVVISSYGKVDTSLTYTDENGDEFYKTIIFSKTLDIDDLDELVD